MRETTGKRAREGTQVPPVSSKVRKISSSAMLSEAADRMKAFGLDGLPVVENNEIVGMVTDRAIARAVSAGMDPSTTPVKYAMTPGGTQGSQETGIGEAAAATEDHQDKENRMKARVTEDCISCGRCVEICPEVFEMGDDKAFAKVDQIPQEFQDAAQEAADECPTSAILIER